MKLDQKLVDAAIQLVEKRFPQEAWAGGAAMLASDGRIFVSTAPHVENESVSLCHEVGAICEAYRENAKITATVCVSRDDQKNYHILTPCGVCQERLMTWGEQVEVAVPNARDSRKWEVKTLAEIQPYYWKKPFLKK